MRSDSKSPLAPGQRSWVRLNQTASKRDKKTEKNKNLSSKLTNGKQCNSEDCNAIYHSLFLAAEHNPGCKLLTVMELDLDAGLAKRAYSSKPDAYPTSGTKPIIHNDWFEKVVVQQKPFLANAPDQMGDQFPDLDLITSLGCGAIVNVPVVQNGKTILVINILHETGFFTPENFQAACALAELFD